MMHEQIVCLPLPQHIEGVDLTERSDAARRILGALLSDASRGDPLPSMEHLASPTLSIAERWRAEIARGAAFTGGWERYTEYDGYFGVHRLAGEDPRACLAEAVLVAYHRLHRDSLRGHSLSPAELVDLQQAFEATFSTLAGVAISPPRDLLAPREPAGTLSGAPEDALLRWKTGHHAFFVLIQALIIAHVRLAATLRVGHIEPAREAFALAALLWRGAAASFRYTGDLTVEGYENVVRPSMRPPFLKEGFSGFFSVDHAHLLRVVKSSRSLFLGLSPELHLEHRLYLEALDTAYEAHAFVCEQFVGEGQSLKGSRKDPSASAPTVIRRDLKKRALWNAGGPDDE